MSSSPGEAVAHNVRDDSDDAWIERLTSEWQIIADLSFADLALWKPEGETFRAIAQCRPSTGPTLHPDVIVGTTVAQGRLSAMTQVFQGKRHLASRVGEPESPVPLKYDAYPVIRHGRAIAVVTRELSQASLRHASRLELNYRAAADELLAMVSRGEFPRAEDSATGARRGAPRVGDGVVRLDQEGVVTYASPNAQSCFYRLGLTEGLVGLSLPATAAALVADRSAIDETLSTVVAGRAAWRADLNVGTACLSLRAIPVTEHGKRSGAVILCRDVTELRRRERELITKDATIREIHHRVKNNLQTVSALLRMQSRRVEATEAKVALADAMRRVQSIALVHDSLSGSLDERVDMDRLVSTTMHLSADLATPETKVETRVEGRFGLLGADIASPLALVITELVANAVEHGFAGLPAGVVTVEARRQEEVLQITVSDNGHGVEKAPEGLGSNIVRTLVTNELGGNLHWDTRAQGTQVNLEIPLVMTRRT